MIKKSNRYFFKTGNRHIQKIKVFGNFGTFIEEINLMIH